MFELKKKIGSIRSGVFHSNKKASSTPCFFATSNFGGGGTNVSRLLVYSDLLSESNINLLLNYYYIDIDSDLSPRFDTSLVEDFKGMKDILDFIKHIKKAYCEKSDALKKDYSISESEWKPVVLLDSGSGNILRNKIKNKELTKDNYSEKYKSVVDDYLSFLEKHLFDIGIVMDFAKKNTYKAGELSDVEYVKNITFFTTKNFDLLKMTLQEQKQKFPNLNLFVPIHGDSLEEYYDYLKNILKLESKEKFLFKGFAIGGLGNPNKVDKTIWGIPDEVNGKVKGMLYLNKIAAKIRKTLDERSDDRPIHILGAASPYNLIPLLLSGMDTFDCHSAWRRASDGNSDSKDYVLKSIKENVKVDGDVKFSKILVPLLKKDLSIIVENKSSFLEFEKLHLIKNDNWNCDCPVCEKFSINQIKELFSGDQERNFFSKILIYIHSIYQYQYICELFSSFDKYDDVGRFIESLPDCSYKTNLKTFLEHII
ncbi:hypothetical protein JXA12_05795 [Candidatus Woesearchaeota archaeon]|nr:hypothetical protein [Candidatus Woesearchaeota archaeon]